MTVKDLAKLLKSEGWVEVRRKGSHHIFKNPERPDLITVPFHTGGKAPHPGLIKLILCQIKRGTKGRYQSAVAA